MNVKIILFLIAIMQTQILFGQSKIIVPNDGDEYSKLVQQAESGSGAIDFKALRFSYLDRKYKKSFFRNDSLRQTMASAREKRDYNKMLACAKQMLSDKYTDLYAMNDLITAYEKLGDSANMRKYEIIEVGMINSIANSGDGKTCATGWIVTDVAEEYFIVSILGFESDSQTLSHDGDHTCDILEVKSDTGEKRTLYFEITKMFAAEAKMFMPDKDKLSK